MNICEILGTVTTSELYHLQSLMVISSVSCTHTHRRLKACLTLCHTLLMWFSCLSLSVFKCLMYGGVLSSFSCCSSQQLHGFGACVRGEMIGRESTVYLDACKHTHVDIHTRDEAHPCIQNAVPESKFA